MDGRSGRSHASPSIAFATGTGSPTDILIVILVSIFLMGLQQVNIFLSVSRTL